MFILIRVEMGTNNGEIISVHNKIDASPNLWFLQKRGFIAFVEK